MKELLYPHILSIYGPPTTPLLPFPLPRSGRHIKTTGLAVAAEKATHIDYSSLTNHQFLLSMKEKRITVSLGLLSTEEICCSLFFGKSRTIAPHSRDSPPPPPVSPHTSCVYFWLSPPLFHGGKKGKERERGEQSWGDLVAISISRRHSTPLLFPLFLFPLSCGLQGKEGGKERADS